MVTEIYYIYIEMVFTIIFTKLHDIKNHSNQIYNHIKKYPEKALISSFRVV